MYAVMVARACSVEMNKIITVAIVTILVCAPGCGVPPSQLGAGHNNVRKEKKLPIVKPDWKVYQSLRTETSWSSPYSCDGTPGHAGKKVFCVKGAVLQEEDYYYSGKTFVPSWDPDASKVSEMVTIHYDYAKTNSPWTCSHVTSNGLTHLSLAEAEDVLRSWGLERLNY